MKRIMGCLLVVVALCETCLAEPRMPAPGEKIKVHRMTPEMREMMRKKNGEKIAKPGSQKGSVLFINTQDVVPGDLFKSLAADLAKETGFNIGYAKVAPGEPSDVKAAANADFAVVIVADDKTPALLSAIEDGWAVVNVKKLDQYLSTPEDKAKFYNARCQKEVLRAFASIGGGMTSQYPGNIMNTTSVKDLDLCDTFIPADRLQDMTKYLAKRGVTPIYMAYYRQACKQGWAPAPTNDVQLAIWNKVHEVPDKPIKIEFDPKRDAGK